MFSIDNNYTKSSVLFIAKHNGEELSFIITPMISKRNKEELDEKLQFILLNQYIKYKGKDFEDQLFELLKQANNNVMKLLYENESDVDHKNPLPYHIVTPLLDFFNLEDVFNYLKFEYKLQPPSILQDVFDEQIEKDAKGSRVQTYLKDDYLQLAALALIIKVAMMPVFNYADIKSKEFNIIHREYILFHLFKKHPIFESEPMVKLLGLVTKLIEQTTTTKDVESVRILEKQIPRGELPFYILSLVVIQKVSIATLIDDNADKNLVTKIYNYVNNKLKASGDVSKSIRNKSNMKDQDDTGESESLVESYRTCEKFDKGTLIELGWAVESIDKVIMQMTDKQKAFIDPKLVKEAEVFCKQFLYADIENIQIQILGIIFKSVIDPRAIDYIKIEGIVNLITVGFAYLWGLGAKTLALILISKVYQTDDDTMTINSTVNKTRLSKELKEELDFFYPYKRVVNADTSSNIIEEAIGDMSQDIYSKKWLPVCDSNYLVDAIGTDNPMQLISSDIKYMLAEFIIKNERNVQHV